MLSVVEVLVIIHYSVPVVRSGYTRSVVMMSIVVKSFICSGCENPVTNTGCTSVDIGVCANLKLVDNFCYLGEILIVDGDAVGPEFELDGINSGSWYCWVKKCIEYEVKDARPRGRPKKTWREFVQQDCQARKLNRVDAVDHSRWRK